MAKYIVRAKLDALASPLITVIYKIGIKIDKTENRIDREAMTKKSLPKLTQSFVPALVALVGLLLSPAFGVLVTPVNEYSDSSKNP